MIEVGNKALDFTLKNSQGEEIKLSNFKGKNIVLYFYPRDNTPGCTKEACGFRDVYDEILDLGGVVIGISPDGEKAHQKFKEKHNLPFYLLCDEEHEVAEKYGSWGEKKMYGKTFMGIIRSTFIIDNDFNIVKVYPKVSPAKHSEEILEFLKNNNK